MVALRSGRTAPDWGHDDISDPRHVALTGFDGVISRVVGAKLVAVSILWHRSFLRPPALPRLPQRLAISYSLLFSAILCSDCFFPREERKFRKQGYSSSWDKCRWCGRGMVAERYWSWRSKGRSPLSCRGFGMSGTLWRQKSVQLLLNLAHLFLWRSLASWLLSAFSYSLSSLSSIVLSAAMTEAETISSRSPFDLDDDFLKEFAFGVVLSWGSSPR